MTGTVSASVMDLLPTLQRCDCLMLQEGEIVIHAPGFEDRTMSVGEVVTGSEGRAVLLDYLPVDARNRLSEVRGMLSGRGVKIEDEDVLQYDRFEPGDFESRLQKRLQYHRAQRVLVDISTMSKLEIMLVLNVCNGLSVRVRVFYCEAQSYGPSQAEFKEAKDQKQIHQPSLQIFTGVHGVVRVDSLASVAMQGQPTAAIVFMSFNDALTQVLLNTVYPSRLFLINGRPPVHAWREEATAWIHDQVRREWEDDNPVEPSNGEGVAKPRRVVSTLDYRETVSLLLELYWQLSVNHRILLAPAGSKLQAVGCYLMKALHPDIHIEYPSPEGFLPPYSIGMGTRWLLDLGQVSERIAEISRAERREYLEIAE